MNTLSIARQACVVAFTTAVALPGLAAEADRFAEVRVTAEHVSGSVHMLTGAGGNIGVSVGADGTLIIDDQFAPLAERIEAALESLGGARPKLVLNTHFHGDHTGSNAFFGRDGTIIAHENVRLRLLGEESVERSALPLVTFDDRVRVHFNDDEIDVIHLPNGHTDTDSVVWFRNSNVIHMGDLLFNGRFPFIDVESGGTVDGFVENLETVLEMVPADVRVIPGHGELTGIASIAGAIEMIRATREQVRDAAASGRSVDDIVAAGLGERWAAYGSGFINEERWIRILLAQPAPARR
jgi:glyoxylase-like metal-dependent hydrolase (beta-lactamase superfamily II)